MRRKQILAIVAAILTGVGGLISGLSMVGRVITLAPMLTLWLSGIACGASIVAARRPKP